MSEELESVLRLVADGTLSPEQAAPIIDALTRAERSERDGGLSDRIGRSVEGAHRRVEEARNRVRAWPPAPARVDSFASASPSTAARS